MDRQKLLQKLSILILVIFIANFLANKFYWYYTVWWFDMPMHFLGGFAVSLIGLYIFHDRKLDFRFVLEILALVFVVGMCYEIYEYCFINYLGGNQLNIVDSSSDIFFDLTGGTVALLYYLKKVQLA